MKRFFHHLKLKYPNIKLKDVTKWLNDQDVYNLFKQIKRKFPRLPILVNKMNEQWQIDLMDITWMSKYNEGYRYLLNVIDCFSRYAWVVPVKTKSANEITDAFRKILQTNQPEKIQSDQGKEFKNSQLISLFKEKGINFFTTTDGTVKCAIVERFNRTLRNRISRFLYFKNSHRFIDDLPKIVKGYNNSYHRTIQMAPSEVNKANEAQVLLNIRKTHPINKAKQKPYKIGDKVRISRYKNIFEKGDTKNFQTEIFEIKKVKKTPQGYIYKLQDYDGEDITSIFYQYELTPAKEPSLYKINEILKTRINPHTKKKEYFVSWLGYPDKFNQWVDNVEST